MAILNAAHIYSLALQAGFGLEQARVVTAIALAESGGNTNAENCAGNTPQGSCDRGLLQLNNYWHREVSDQCAYDPLCAMKAAYRISKQGRDFSSWVTYTKGDYLKQINNLQNIPQQIAQQSEQQQDTGKKYPWNTGKSLLTPNASVGDVLIRLDDLLAVYNPVDLNLESPWSTPGSPSEAAENTPFVGSFLHILNNVMADFAAITLRLVIIIVGITLLVKSPTFIGASARAVGGGVARGSAKLIEIGAMY